MTVENFTKASEGTYTIQIQDGKAKSQSSLVLVGDGKDWTASSLRAVMGFLYTTKKIKKANVLGMF